MIRYEIDVMALRVRVSNVVGVFEYDGNVPVVVDDVDANDDDCRSNENGVDDIDGELRGDNVVAPTRETEIGNRCAMVVVVDDDIVIVEDGMAVTTVRCVDGRDCCVTIVGDVCSVVVVVDSTAGSS